MIVSLLQGRASQTVTAEDSESGSTMTPICWSSLFVLILCNNSLYVFAL